MIKYFYSCILEKRPYKSVSLKTAQNLDVPLHRVSLGSPSQTVMTSPASCLSHLLPASYRTFL